MPNYQFLLQTNGCLACANFQSDVLMMGVKQASKYYGNAGVEMHHTKNLMLLPAQRCIRSIRWPVVARSSMLKK
jgi:hypothetical protein